MRAFVQFRLWGVRAGRGERLASGVAAAVVVAVGVGAFVPGGERSTTQGLAEQIAEPTNDSAGQTDGAGATRADGTRRASGASDPESAAGGGSLSAGAGASEAGTETRQGCVPPPGSDQGVGATEIKIAVTVINLVGDAGNSAFDIPSAEETEEYFQNVIDSINASGGVACRKLVAQYYRANPADQSDLQSTCADIQQAKVFSVIDTAAFALHPSLAASCFAERQIPFWGGTLSQEVKDEHYPYLFGGFVYDVLYRDTVFALKERGFFSPDNGFEKLGYFYRDCYPKYVKDFEGWLYQVGLSSEQVVSYSMGCPSALYAPPSTVQAAVLRFQQEGVTHVSMVNDPTDFANFTAIAEQQGYRPKYGIPDDGVVCCSSGTGYSASWDNMNDTVAITLLRYGEPTTPGLRPSAGTRKCDAIHKAQDRPSVYEQKAAMGGYACNILWMFAAAVDRAPALRGNALAAGLHAAGSVEFSYPSGPNDFTGSRVTTGGQFWRPVQFYASCRCWRVLDSAFRPNF